MTFRHGIIEVTCAAESDDELAFLNGIVENLSAPLPKLVYADWLEERDDPRGPFLRQFVESASTSGALLPTTKGFSRPWLDAVGVHGTTVLRKAVKKVGLPRDVAAAYEKRMLELARPTVHLLAIPTADTSVPVGESKFGGFADLPRGTPWPAADKDDPSRYQLFYGQIRLSDLRGTLAARLLPASGLLALFGDTYGGWGGVHLFDESTSLVRVPLPPQTPVEDPYYEYFPLPPCRLRMIEGIDLPFFLETLVGNGLTRDQLYRQSDFADALHPAAPRGAWRYSKQQMLGWAGFMNALPTPEEVSQRRLLISFRSSDLKGGVYWGDSANRFFFSLPDDMKAGKFGNVHLAIG